MANLSVFGGLWLGNYLKRLEFQGVRWISHLLDSQEEVSDTVERESFVSLSYATLLITRRYDVCKATLLAMEDGGLLFLLLFRASPLMPFAISNIVLGRFVYFRISLISVLYSFLFIF